MSAIIPFDYKGARVRTVLRDGEPWFVLPDVCRVLDLEQPHRVAARLEDDEKEKLDFSDALNSTGAKINDLGLGEGNNQVWVVNEPGIYNLIFTSRKPEAKRFKRWVTHEVLPSLRRSGTYSLTDATGVVVRLPAVVTLSPEDRENIRAVKEYRCLFGAAHARALWASLGLPIIYADSDPLARAAQFEVLARQGLAGPEIAVAQGVSPRSVQQHLKVLRELVEPAKRALRSGQLSMTQARAIVLGDAETQVALLSAVQAGEIETEEDILLLLRTLREERRDDA